MPSATSSISRPSKSAAQITLSIREIYSRFRIPPNLQMHMMRVAAVGALVCDNWKGPAISKEEIVAALLIHDLANIVKFNLDSPQSTALPQGELGRIEFWKAVKADVIKRYGADDHAATLKMVEEVGAPDKLKTLLDDLGKVEDGAADPAGFDDWPLKICLYSDMRVGLNGVVSIEQRIADLLHRYRGTPKEEKFRKLGDIAPPVCKEVIRNTLLDPEAVNDESIESYLREFQQG